MTKNVLSARTSRMFRVLAAATLFTFLSYQETSIVIVIAFVLLYLWLEFLTWAFGELSAAFLKLVTSLTNNKSLELELVALITKMKSRVKDISDDNVRH